MSALVCWPTDRSHQAISETSTARVFLTQFKLARRCRPSWRTPEKWRRTEQGPTYIKLGGGVYRLKDAEAYETERWHQGGGTRDAATSAVISNPMRNRWFRQRRVERESIATDPSAPLTGDDDPGEFVLAQPAEWRRGRAEPNALAQ